MTTQLINHPGDKMDITRGELKQLRRDSAALDRVREIVERFYSDNQYTLVDAFNDVRKVHKYGNYKLDEIIKRKNQ